MPCGTDWSAGGFGAGYSATYAEMSASHLVGYMSSSFGYHHELMIPAGKEKEYGRSVDAWAREQEMNAELMYEK